MKNPLEKNIQLLIDEMRKLEKDLLEKEHSMGSLIATCERMEKLRSHLYLLGEIRAANEPKPIVKPIIN